MGLGLERRQGFHRGITNGPVGIRQEGLERWDSGRRTRAEVAECLHGLSGPAPSRTGRSRLAMRACIVRLASSPIRPRSMIASAKSAYLASPSLLVSCSLFLKPRARGCEARRPYPDLIAVTISFALQDYVQSVAPPSVEGRAKGRIAAAFRCGELRANIIEIDWMISLRRSFQLCRRLRISRF